MGEISYPTLKIYCILSLCSIKSKFRGILKPFVCFHGNLDFLRFVEYQGRKMDVCFVALWMNHLNIVTVRWFETLLNNRLLLKGITFAKMYDTFWQKPFYIKITWLLNLTGVIFRKVYCSVGENFFASKSYGCNN